ncbi:MAG TPA: lamin tail domain-containing protein, partial [bacterium]|nr:lamin tail domain-containing protein [bacterium]
MKYSRLHAATLFLLLLALLCGPASAQNILINEAMSSNNAFITDEEGDYPDWLELYNPGDTAVDLANWGLSDKKGTPGKWLFPQVSIGPKSWMLIFADSKDRK